MRTTPAIAALLLASGLAAAAPIPVTNHSFEADPAPDGNYVVLGAVSGWTLYDPNNLASMGTNVIGVICPIGADYYDPDEAPDARNLALIFILDSIGMGPMGLEQSLGVDLQPNTVYTLTVAIGNIAQAPGVPPNPPTEFPLNGFPGYAIQLLAGGAVLDEDVNSVVIPDAATADATVEFTTGPVVDPNLEISIRLINLNMEDEPDPGIEVNFDNVRLDASPAPVLCAGDLDGDNDTDVFDFNIFAPAFGTSLGDPGFVPEADLNGDETIDVFDFNLFAPDFGCPGPLSARMLTSR